MTGAAFIFLALAAVLYFMPAIVAFNRGVEHATPIAALNLALGWTGCGWVLALLWACYSRPGHGGEFEIVPTYLDGHVVGRKIQLPYPLIEDMRVRYDPPPLRRY
jgi:hypothetical protein